MAKKKPFPLSKVYSLIEPGPVVLLTTMNGKQPNVMTMAWHMMVDFEPPLLACIIGEGGRTFEILKKTKQCAINIPTVELAEAVIACGSVSGAKVNKFEKAGLTLAAASRVKAPLINECYASLECKVVDARQASKYNMFIMEVVEAWIDKSVKNPRTLHHVEKGQFIVDGDRIKLPFKMK